MPKLEGRDKRCARFEGTMLDLYIRFPPKLQFLHPRGLCSIAAKENTSVNRHLLSLR